MSPSRGALLGLAALWSMGALAVACSAFDGAADTTPADDAGPTDSGAVSTDAGDSAVVVDASAPDSDAGRFCSRQPATAILCDDFEANDGSLANAWKPTMTGGDISVVTIATREGHVAKLTASGATPDVTLALTFPAASARAGVTLDFDMLVDTLGFEYMDLGWVHTAGADAAYFGGVAKGGTVLGRTYSPQAGPNIPLDNAWHHVRVELGRTVDAGFAQRVTIDAKTINTTTTSLADQSFAEMRLGTLANVLNGGTSVVVLYYDNVLLIGQ